MSGVTTFTTTSSPVRRLVSPLSSAKSRNIAKGATTTNDYGCQREDELASNSHGFTRSNISTPRVDSCILGKVTVEQRDKFTLYKIEVNDGEKSWIIYRRYKEFVLLNKKLRRLYPQFRLSLPERRIFKNNFAKG
ncbi:Sorting nexin-16 [Acropora cervicornis]|uniref:Sorting nexin-16 n=1 Tax=Acropora cervicornis TaxID=6130 RepID=A0AAD9Q4Y8_ACRCE|nr:Sorting nexin-16 [Acropora cervicornis]